MNQSFEDHWDYVDQTAIEQESMLVDSDSDFPTEAKFAVRNAANSNVAVKLLRASDATSRRVETALNDVNLNLRVMNINLKTIA